MSWTDLSNNETGFRIERCQGAGCTTFAEVAQVATNVSTYSDAGLAAATTYSYRVRAANGAGNSSYTNTAAATTLSSAPVAPTNLTATAASSTTANLTWTDNAANETGFRIERCQGAGCTTFAEVGLVGANVTTSW